ncbi:UvrD-helicase domain-containing protein [Atopobium fossor]|uniref:UvrD-helicase domain-containing protein n=1 Tax=Atopobium fossor TaxID=39487 RepID=UPI00041B480C|nr:UvrD-helicase domain-containing protein [Atopobium fossor]
MDFSTFMEGQKKTVTTLDKTLFVAAGAGSGKTFTLTQRVAWALMPGSGKDGSPYLDSIDQLLVITFTHAAAEEIKERVRAVLKKEGLTQASLEVDGAWISTIHGMCGRILRAHALALGIDPEFEMLDSVGQTQLMNRAIEDVLTLIEGDSTYAPLFKVHRARAKTITEGESSQSVAGMIFDLMQQVTNSPVGFDAVTFCGATYCASSQAVELKNRYEELLFAAQSAKKADELTAPLIDSIQKLDEFTCIAPGLQTPLALLDLLQTLHRPSGNSWRGKIFGPLNKEVQFAYDTALFEATIAYEQELSPLLMALTRRVWKRYRLLKQKQSALDNDDLLTLAADALQQHPEIAAQYAHRFKLVMVDEFQDTSEQQVRMIKLLSGPHACHLTTVGDAQQSIYRFRGADVDVFLRRGEELPEENKPQLSENFRSHDDILRFVATVCGAPGMLPNFMDLIAKRKEKVGYPAADVPRIYTEVTKRVYGVSKNYGIIAAAEQVANRIAYFVNEKHVKPGDIALLMGKLTNSQVYVDALRARGIDSVVTGGSGFSSAPEVLMVANLVSVLSNPYNSGRLFELLTSDLFALDADDILLLGTALDEQTHTAYRQPLEHGLWAEELPFEREPSARLKNAITVLNQAWSILPSKPVYEVVRQVLHDSGWLARLEHTNATNNAIAANVLACVRYLKQLCETYCLGASQICNRFDAWLTHSKISPAALVGSELNAVSVMTIHSSKGLEFPLVAVVDALDDAPFKPSARGLLAAYQDDKIICGLRPSGCSPADTYEAPDQLSISSSAADVRMFLETHDAAAEAAEKIRLLYVALTRAKETVILHVPLMVSSKSIAPALGAKVAEVLFGDIHELTAGAYDLKCDAGTRGIARVICLKAHKDETGNKVIEASDPSDCGVVQKLEQMRLDIGNADIVNALDNQLASQQDFELYTPAATKSIEQISMSPHHGIYSYSSMAAQLEKGVVADIDLPQDMQVRMNFGLAASMDCEHNVNALDVLVNQDVLDEPSSRVLSTHTDNPDDNQPKATNLGSAFHELAQIMVQTRSSVSIQQIQRLAMSWECSRLQTQRLQVALERWAHSDIRAEALSYSQVQPEVPFFCKRASEFGNYIEGAIDLLCTNPGDTHALVVDYKTGDAHKTAEQLYNSHTMQAQVYADVLLNQGFKSVECAFVCVERDDGQGQPVVVRYTFSKGAGSKK